MKTKKLLTVALALTVLSCGTLASLGCAAKKSNNSSKSSGTDGSGSEKPPTLSQVIKKNSDTIPSAAELKASLREKDPELTKKCVEMSKSFAGHFAGWNFAVDHWVLDKSRKPLTSKEMEEKGFGVTSRLETKEVEVTIDEAKLVLTTKLKTATEDKTVVWDILPLTKGYCQLFQEVGQTGQLLNDWIAIMIPVQTGGSKSAKFAFEFFNVEGKYEALGNVELTR